MAGTARYLVERGKYQRGEAWGYEVDLSPSQARLADNRTKRTYGKWYEAAIRRADGKPFPREHDVARLWQPVAGRPGVPARPKFLCGAIL